MAKQSNPLLYKNILLLLWYIWQNIDTKNYIWQDIYIYKISLYLYGRILIP